MTKQGGEDLEQQDHLLQKVAAQQTRPRARQQTEVCLFDGKDYGVGRVLLMEA